MSDKASEILKNIEKRKIKPKSKWIFLAKDYLVWGLFGITTLIGAGAMGVIIFIINDNDWDIYTQLEKSCWTYYLILMPYFWIIVLCLLLFLAYFNYTRTRKGYLLNPYVVILSSILISILLGWVLFASGISEKIDKFFAQKIPYYKTTDMHKIIFWSNPDRGLMAGEITSIKDTNNFSLKDLNGKDWIITGKNITWEKGANLRMGEKVKIIGKMNAKNNIYKAQEVRPWSCGCSLCDKDDDTKL